MIPCRFCNPEFQKAEAFFDNEFFFAVFDNHPVSPGHAIVVPKRHTVDLKDLSHDEWNHLQETIQRVISSVETTDLRDVYTRFIEAHSTDNSMFFCQEALKNPRVNTKPDAYNHGINDGRAAGRTVDHLHWHIIPRYENDVDDPTGGVRFVIPKNGNYKKQR